MNNLQTITIAGKSGHPLTVSRLGYGAMRLTGPEIWGEPANRPEALQILKTAVENGVNFIDTADFYGDDITNRLIQEALYPYKDDLIICTKIGATRKPDKSWVPFNKPDQLRTSIEKNLTTLKIDRVDLVHYRRMPGVGSLEEGLEAMFAMQSEGKILHIGVSNVSPAELETAMQIGEIATVENMYGHAQRSTMKTPQGENRGGEVLEACEKNEIAFIPFFSLVNAATKKDTRISEIAKKYGVTDTQLNIAWLLHKSPWILPIPGTSSLAHFEENMKAADIQLTEKDMAYLD